VTIANGACSPSESPRGAWRLPGLGTHKKIAKAYGHWLVPAFFVIIGGLVVVESGVLTRIF
jgi:hypothetical protein